MKNPRKAASIICLSTYKGGVGKTASTLNLGAALARLNKNVLLIDLDPSADLSFTLGVQAAEENIYEGLKGGNCTPIVVNQHLDLIPAHPSLSDVDLELGAKAGRSYLLRELLTPLRNRYDYILIDTPPSLSLLTLNGLTAADKLLIPLQAQYLSLRGVTRLLDVVAKVKKGFNPSLGIAGVFLTQYDARKVMSRTVFEGVQEGLPTRVFNTKIRDNVALAEAAGHSMDIFRYNPSSYGAADYAALCEELLKSEVL